MISGTTAVDVAIVLLEELGLGKARRVADRLGQVKGNKSFTNSIKAVRVTLRLDPRKLLEVTGGLKAKVIVMGKE